MFSFFFKKAEARGRARPAERARARPPARGPQGRHSTVAAELLRLEVAEASELLAIRQLPLGNKVKSTIGVLEEEVKGRIDGLHLRWRILRPRGPRPRRL